MPFPSIVNVAQAVGVVGDFADSSPTASVPGSFVASSEGVAIGRFCWLNAGGSTVSNFGIGLPLGFVHRENQALITQFLGETSLVIPKGLPVIPMTVGTYWVINSGTTAATRGMKAYVDSSTGLITFAATSNPPTSAVVSGTIAANVVTGSVSANTVTGSIAGAVLTVSVVSAGVLVPGQTLAGTGINVATTIVSQTSGTAGGAGVYAVSVEQTVASTTITASGGCLTVTAVTSGTLAVGQTISGTGVTTGTTITNLGTGTGGTGKYAVSISQTASSTTVTASGGTLTVASVTSGTVEVDDVISGTGVTTGNTITAALTGTGGAGTYLVSIGDTVSSAVTITVVAGVETKWYAASDGAAGELVKMTSWAQG